MSAARVAAAAVPDAAAPWIVLTAAAGAADMAERAAVAGLRALRLSPDSFDARVNLARALEATGRRDAAAAVLRPLLALAPDCADGWNRLGQIRMGDGDAVAASGCWRRVAALRPDDDAAQWRSGFALLLTGPTAEGWRAYERRPQPPPPARPSRRWRGAEDLAGGDVLIRQEQGLGDLIQFIRYAALLKAQGAGRVTAECPAALRRLLGAVPGVDAFIAPDEDVEHDWHIPLMSLPGALAARPVPAPPYLTAEPERVARWRERLGTHGFKIGIVWTGKPSGGRGVPLAAFEPLARVPGVRLISLQKHHGLEELNALPAGMRVEVLGDDFDAGADAFIDTAAAMSCLDLTVSADAAPAHVAGALGRPVWLALGTAPDWRWFVGRPQSTPWYPTARLFRQPRPGDWAAVGRAMATAL